jgi:hypothetical protein
VFGDYLHGLSKRRLRLLMRQFHRVLASLLDRVLAPSEVARFSKKARNAKKWAKNAAARALALLRQSAEDFVCSQQSGQHCLCPWLVVGRARACHRGLCLPSTVRATLLVSLAGSGRGGINWRRGLRLLSAARAALLVSLAGSGWGGRCSALKLLCGEVQHEYLPCLGQCFSQLACRGRRQRSLKSMFGRTRHEHLPWAMRCSTGMMSSGG